MTLLTHWRGLSGLTLLVILTTATLATAATIVVRPDGSGDATTIGAALSLAVDGDEILVGPGTYPEQLVVTTDVALRGEAGAESTVLDGEDSRWIMRIEAGAAVTLTDLTFTRARDESNTTHGAAILIWEASVVDISACRFLDNYAGWDNGAFHVRGLQTSVVASDCTFLGNGALHNGGACGVGYQGQLTLLNCAFSENLCSGISGAVNAYGAASLVVEECLFTDNAAAVGAIVVESSPAGITRSTFVNNTSYNHASVLFYNGSSGTFAQNIVVGDTAGGGLRITGSCDHRCNLYDANQAGAIIGDSPEPDELLAPALFCGPATDDYSLCADSPALAANNSCGLMGAFGQGCAACGVVAREAHSWSTVKQLFD